MTSKTEKIQFSSGCPNNCDYCKEPTLLVDYTNMTQDLKGVKKGGDYQILDMNFLANPCCDMILEELPKARYELVCGIDYRKLNLDRAELLKKKGFVKVRWAWDYNFGQQRKHQHIWVILKKVGYRSEDLSVFILVNWKIPYRDCCKKLDLLKVWNVKVNDCCFDGGYKLAKPLYWTPEQIKKFRAKCRKHNQMVRFKIDPEFK